MPMHLWGSTQTWEVAGLEEAGSAKEVAGCVTRAYITVRWSMSSTHPQATKESYRNQRKIRSNRCWEALVGWEAMAGQNKLE